MIEAIITGICTGIFAGGCSTIGAYFSNKLIIKHLDKIEEKMKVKK